MESFLLSSNDPDLSRMITREWIDGNNVERSGDTVLSSLEQDLVHLDFAEELYSALLKTAKKIWELLSTKHSLRQHYLRALKDSLGRLYLVRTLFCSQYGRTSP